MALDQPGWATVASSIIPISNVLPPLKSSIPAYQAPAGRVTLSQPDADWVATGIWTYPFATSVAFTVYKSDV